MNALPPRRALAAIVLIAAALASAPAGAEKSHGLSAFGQLKYPPDFKHFDYVNPDAPTGGRLSMIGTAGIGTFNSLNAYILKGDAAQGMEHVFDSLMTRATDEPDSVYGLVAYSAELAPDRRTVTFYLREEPRFADGSPLTAEDVVFSLEILKLKGHPNYQVSLADVEKVEAIDPRTVRYTFKGDRTRDLPQLVAVLPIFSKAYYSKRPFDETTLEPPLGSGPYMVGEFAQGRYITYKRRPDYWGWKLAVNRGVYNFGELRYEYFRDRTAEFEALKANVYDLREEFTSKTWATEYKIPQVASGRMILQTLPDETPSGVQGFFINMRRDKFKDARVRKALDYAFDFEWANKNTFFGLYKRIGGYFENSDMKADGKPDADELALLEPFRDKLPATVFDEPYVSPVSDGSGQDRRLLREAGKMLDDAGWTIKNGKRVNAKGEVLEIEFLLDEPSFERITGPLIKNLRIVGIDARVRIVDPAQYESRKKSFDFDLLAQRYVLDMTPGPELKNYWGSESAGLSGSLNLSGISDPVVDALILKVLEAKTRKELVTATKALDRVLRAGHYWVPHWYKAAHNLAFWDKYSWPATKPKYDRGVIQTWWYDEAKAAKLAQSR